MPDFPGNHNGLSVYRRRDPCPVCGFFVCAAGFLDMSCLYCIIFGDEQYGYEFLIYSLKEKRIFHE